MTAAKPKLVPLETPAFQIELGVPVPPDRRGRADELTEPLRALSQAPIGASLFCPSTAERNQSRRLGARIIGAFGKGCLTIRKVEGGIRVWKIAEPTKGGAK